MVFAFLVAVLLLLVIFQDGEDITDGVSEFLVAYFSLARWCILLFDHSFLFSLFM